MTIKRLTGKGKITIKPKNADEVMQQYFDTHATLNRIKDQDNDSLSAVEDRYLKAKRRQRGFKSFKLFSLDASDLQVLDDIELTKETTHAEVRVISKALDKHQSDFRGTHQQIKNIEKMIQDAVKTNDTILLAEAKALLENIPNIKKDIIAKKSGLLTSVNAILKLELDDDN